MALVNRINGNSSFLAANTTSGNTQIVMNTNNGLTPSVFYVMNDSSSQSVCVNISTSPTANAVVATGDQDGVGIMVYPYYPLVINAGQQYNQAPGNIYITAVTPTGSANVYITPVSI
jgi:copper(I)-binding protein